MEDELRHYGVVGMRCGRRKNVSRAFGKSSKKADRLTNKANKADRKVAKLTNKRSKYESLGDSDKVNKISAKLEKATAKRNLKQEKADKWISSMSSTFKTAKMSEISYEDLIAGQNYVTMLRKK